MNVGALLAVAVLLLVNGYFVALEFAAVGSRRSRLEPLAETGDRAARRALGVVADLNSRLAGAQLGITITSLLLGVVGEPAVAALFETFFDRVLPTGVAQAVSFVVALAVVVFLHMVIGEMVPKNLALADPEGALKVLSGPDRLYTAVFRPFIWFLNALGNAGVRLLGLEPRGHLGSARSAEELAAVVATSRQVGAIDDRTAELLTGVLAFSGRTVDDVMVSREQVVTMSRTTTLAEAEELLVHHGHSRIPVTGDGGLDDVVGFVHGKDLVSLAAPAASRPLPLRLIRRILVVSVDRSLEDVLTAMRHSQVHLALVQHHDGTTAGLVTLDDLLEELLGGIVDEFGAIGAGPDDDASRTGWS